MRLSPIAVLVCCAVGCTRPPQPVSTAAITQDAQVPVAVTYNPLTGRPSFLRSRIAIAPAYGLPATDTSPEIAKRMMAKYSAVFGADTGAMVYVGARVDTLGMRHMTLKQVYQGVDVYAAGATVHLAREGGIVVAVHSSLVPGISATTTQPAISEDSARTIAAGQLPHGVAGASRLVLYPGRRRAAAADLAWMVEVRDDSIPARNEYVIDAARGRVLDVLDRLYTARDRRTHDAGGGTALPGTLRRDETAPPVGDADVDSAHAFVGQTYDYFAGTHARDSYDGAGAALITTVHYSVNYQNAFWNGAQMVFGDGFAVEDVTAHELTHAVTERTANLEYRWQSGALNESFSDIFGAMVDRDDWVMGEDLPIGAIRDLENPGAFGQPAHTNAWVETCSDNEGVHTNSGITNRAFVNVAASIGKDDAERVFFRALTVYLGSQATLEDARAAALQSAEDLFGASSPQVQAVTTGFDAVGLNGSFQPPVNNCGGVPGVPDVSLVGLVALVLLIALAMARRTRRPPARA